MEALINYFRLFIPEFISFYIQFSVQTQRTSFGVRIIRLVFLKYFQYDILGVVLVSDTPYFIWNSVLLWCFSCFKGFYVVCITVFSCVASMHMKPQFPQAWLPHSSHEINQIAGSSDHLCWINFEISESEPYISDVILSIPLCCKC